MLPHKHFKPFKTAQSGVALLRAHNYTHFHLLKKQYMKKCIKYSSIIDIVFQLI